MCTNTPTIESLRIDHNTLEELTERFTALHKQECDYKCNDYLGGMKEEKREEGKKVVDEKCRQTMVKWSFKILEFCQSSEETGGLAIYYLDKFLSTDAGEFVLYDRRWFQLGVMCSLHLAIKMNESERLDVEALLQLGRGCFTVDELVLMEEEMLFALAWRLCPPTPHVFLEAFSQLLPNHEHKEDVLQTARKQINSSLSHYSLIHISPSNLAFAAIINAIDLIQDFPRDVRMEFIRSATVISHVKYTHQDMRSLRIKLRKVVSNRADRTSSEADTTSKPRTSSSEPTSPVCVSQVE